MGRDRLPLDAAAATPRIGRRQLVRRAGFAAIGFAALPLLAACRGSAPTIAPTSTVSGDNTPTVPAPSLPPTPTPVLHQGASLRLWALSSVAPAADRQLQALATEWAREQGAEVAVEFVSVGALKARLATPGATGADIIQCRDNWAWLWPDQFADLGREADQLSNAGGGFFDAPGMHGRVNGIWKAIPFSVAPTAVIYRADQYRDAGAASFPATLNDLLAVGSKLKAAGHPFGAPAGRSSDDPRALWSAVLWSFGGRMVEADGKTIAIGAQETRAALDWAAQFWSAACDEDGLGWDDNANNRLYTNGQISATMNNPAIYLYSKEALPDLAAQSNHAVFSAGPVGQGGPVTTYAHAVLKTSQQQAAARDFLLWLGQPAQTERYFAAGGGALVPAWSTGVDSALWTREPKMRPFFNAAQVGRWVGWPAPPTPAATAASENLVVVDLFANVFAGMPAQQSIAAAETALRGFYKA
jgi:multiple sugar transport system substrate-binding protein